MKINSTFKEFKKKHIKKKHQILFKSRICKEYYKVENLFRFLLAEKNSFIFESVEKGKIKGRYTIIGLNPDRIWDVNNNKIIAEQVKPMHIATKMKEHHQNKYKTQHQYS